MEFVRRVWAVWRECRRWRSDWCECVRVECWQRRVSRLPSVRCSSAWRVDTTARVQAVFGQCDDHVAIALAIVLSASKHRDKHSGWPHPPRRCTWRVQVTTGDAKSDNATEESEQQHPVLSLNTLQVAALYRSRVEAARALSHLPKLPTEFAHRSSRMSPHVLKKANTPAVAVGSTLSTHCRVPHPWRATSHVEGPTQISARRCDRPSRLLSHCSTGGEEDVFDSRRQ